MILSLLREFDKSMLSDIAITASMNLRWTKPFCGERYSNSNVTNERTLHLNILLYDIVIRFLNSRVN